MSPARVSSLPARERPPEHGKHLCDDRSKQTRTTLSAMRRRRGARATASRGSRREHGRARTTLPLCGVGLRVGGLAAGAACARCAAPAGAQDHDARCPRPANTRGGDAVRGTGLCICRNRCGEDLSAPVAQPGARPARCAPGAAVWREPRRRANRAQPPFAAQGLGARAARFVAATRAGRTHRGRERSAPARAAPGLRAGASRGATPTRERSNRRSTVRACRPRSSPR